MAKKTIFLIMIIVITIGSNLFGSTVYGAGKKTDKKDSIDSVIDGAKDFLEEGQETTVDTDKLKDTSDYIYNLLLAFAMIIAVIIGMVIGIQFIMASVEEKAKIKEALMPYVVGCIIVFGAFGIWKFAISTMNMWSRG